MADKVTCTKQCYFYRGDVRVSSSRSTESGLTPGLSFTPSHPNHMPNYDRSIYTSYRITYNGRNCTTDSITCPNSNFTITYNFYGEAEKPRIDKWSWNTSNGNASASDTRTAYSAVRNNGRLSDFSYLVWNDMVDKVREVLESKNLLWNSRFASYAATKMSYGSKILTADRFNSLRYNIGLHYSTGIRDVYKGDIVYGWYFTTLTNCINEWIDD